MIRRPPRSTRTDTLFPYTTLFRSSVLSKKIAAGSTHVVIDIPVGPTAKVRSKESARHLAERMRAVAARAALEARCLLTDGTQPVGRGVGAALEARDVLVVLRNAPEAPDEQVRKSTRLNSRQ